MLVVLLCSFMVEGAVVSVPTEETAVLLLVSSWVKVLLLGVLLGVILTVTLWCVCKDKCAAPAKSLARPSKEEPVKIGFRQGNAIRRAEAAGQITLRK